MTEASAWLLALGRYLAARELYRSDHPKVASTFEELVEKLRELQVTESSPSFSFLEGKVIFGDSPLEEMEGWEWGQRFREAGMGRLELLPGVEPEELWSFLEALSGAVREGSTVEEAAGEDASFPNVRYGPLELRDQREATADEAGEAYRGTLSLKEEAETVAWLHEAAEETGRIPELAAVATVESLSMALHGARELVTPFLKLREVDEYTAAHCINVSLVTMSLAEQLGYGSAAVKELGMAGLLHDIGKIAIPTEILNKPGKPDAEEWAEIRRHPVEGARLLSESGHSFELAAVVAYEHHRGVDGSGYPEPSTPRPPCRETRLVQVCDVYDAVRTKRAYSSPLPAEAARGILEADAGGALDAEMVGAFLEFIQQWDAPGILLEEGGPGARPKGAEERPIT